MATYNPFRKTVFNAEKEIPSLAGKVILVTGGTGGLGQQTVVSFAQHDPAHVYFTGRSQPGADQTIKLAAAQAPKTPVSFIKCDLASLESVRNAAKDFLSKESRLDILNANAGIMAVPAGLTKDGYEIQFGTNHVGHALLVKLLTPLMLETAKLPGADVRIVWDSSLGHKGHTSAGIEFDTLRTPQEGIMGGRFVSSTLGAGPWVRYAQSKLANILYAREFAKRYPSITSVSVHPGISATGLVDGLNWMQKIFVYSTSYAMMIPAEQCAWNQQWAMTAKLGKGEKEVENGLYYEPVGVKARSTKRGEDDELAARLWEWTEKELEGWKL